MILLILKDLQVWQSIIFFYQQLVCREVQDKHIERQDRQKSPALSEDLHISCMLLHFNGYTDVKSAYY